jgi:hypothetical protein
VFGEGDARVLGSPGPRPRDDLGAVLHGYGYVGEGLCDYGCDMAFGAANLGVSVKYQSCPAG